MSACGFCQYQQDAQPGDAWLLHEATPYGPEQAPMRREMWLCPFCASSMVVSHWLAWGDRDTTIGTFYPLAKDQAMFANMLAALIPRPPAT